MKPYPFFSEGETIALVALLSGAYHKIPKGENIRNDAAVYKSKFVCGCVGELSHGRLRRRKYQKDTIGYCRKCATKRSERMSKQSVAKKMAAREIKNMDYHNCAWRKNTEIAADNYHDWDPPAGDVDYYPVSGADVAI